MINNITKTAYEKFEIYADFSHQMSADDSISSQTLVCVNTLTGVDTKTTIIDSHTISSFRIKIVIKAGTNKDLHHLTSIISTADGTKGECDIYLSVQDITSGSFRKQSSEQFGILFDFGNRINEETIDTKSITAIKISDASDATSTIIGSAVIDGNTVGVEVIAGTSSESYLISVKVVTDINAYQLEKIVRLDVIEK